MSELILPRRKLLTGIGALLVSSLAAPAIVRAASLMPVRALPRETRIHLNWITYRIRYDAVGLKYTAYRIVDDKELGWRRFDDTEWTYAV